MTVGGIVPERRMEGDVRRLRAAVESAPTGILMIDADGLIMLANREVERLLGYAQGELLGMRVEMLLPERFRADDSEYRGAFGRDASVRPMGAGRELFVVRKDGSEIPVEIGLTPVESDDGFFVISCILDATERRSRREAQDRLENQLRQSQKMESLGALAGGIAHDFNNILGAIVGYAELAKDGAETMPSVIDDLEAILKAAERGRQLVDSIMQFTRRQSVDRRQVDMGNLVTETSRLLRAMLPANVDIAMRLPPALPPVMVDATSIQQVLMNLVSNASHAMPNGGRLEILLEPQYVRDSAARSHPGLKEGSYVVLSIADQGSGMDEETRLKALEPFFTTRSSGQGSGLGLSVVQGILRDHDGTVDLISSPGNGTTVRCYIPAMNEAESARPAHVPPELTGPRVLLVDDEVALTQVGKRRLEALGYRVTATTDPRRALTLFQEQPESFDFIITDHYMPRLTGLELAKEIRRVRRHTPIALVSGFVADLDEREIEAAGISVVLKKPATAQELAHAAERCAGLAAQRATT